MKEKGLNYGEATINLVFVLVVLLAWLPEFRPASYSDSEIRTFLLTCLLSRLSILAVKHYIAEASHAR